LRNKNISTTIGGFKIEPLCPSNLALKAGQYDCMHNFLTKLNPNFSAKERYNIDMNVRLFNRLFDY